MKLNIIKAFAPFAALALLAAGCEKQVDKIAAPENTDLSSKAFLQVYDATLGSVRTYLYIDALPVSGAALSFGATTSPFPQTPSNVSVTDGFREFLIKDTLASSTQPQLSFGENLQAGSYYTIFTYDTVNAIKQSTVTNNIVIPSDTTARIRFANFPYSPTNPALVDVFSYNLNANVFSNIALNQVTDYITYASNKVDTLYIRPAGTGVNLVNKTSATVATPVAVKLAINPTPKRSYTLIFKGGYRSDVNGAATVRSLAFFSTN